MMVAEVESSASSCRGGETAGSPACGSSLARDEAMARRISEAVAEQGGRAYYVGGCVRDWLMGRTPKDLDIEVHGIAPEQLKLLLSGFGTCMERGAGFGILALAGYDLDIAQPRKEEARGARHRDFDIEVDPFIGTKRAAHRRDFIVNALMKDVLTGQVIDHFGGREDLEKGILRHVSEETFADDPLRVLRGAQFAARFGFSLAPETIDLCRDVDLSTLSSERVFDELVKALEGSCKPSVFFETLRDMGQLDVWFPEVKDLIGVPQPPDHHPEGDVWSHTMLVLDRAAELREGSSASVSFMLSALCHDFGKPQTTAEKNGRLHAYGHEEAGVPLAENFVRRLTRNKKLLRYVKNMVLLHMRPNMMVQRGSSQKSFNRLFDSSVAPDDLLLLARADHEGRTGRAGSGCDEIESELNMRLTSYRDLMARPHVTGADLVAAGLEPGPRFGDVLEYAHKLRLAGIEKDEALRQTLGFARKLK